MLNILLGCTWTQTCTFILATGFCCQFRREVVPYKTTMKTRKHKLSSPNLLLSATCQQDLEETTNGPPSAQCDITQEVVHSLKLKSSLGKMGGGGRLLSFWEGLCSVAILVSNVCPWKLTYPKQIDAWIMKLPFLIKTIEKCIEKNDWKMHGEYLSIALIHIMSKKREGE